MEEASATTSSASVKPGNERREEGVLSWADYHMSVAVVSAKRSKDPAKQVGHNISTILF